MSFKSTPYYSCDARHTSYRAEGKLHVRGLRATLVWPHVNHDKRGVALSRNPLVKLFRNS